MKQIYKTIFREFRFEKKRTFLLFLVFFVIIAFPLAMFSIEPSISSSVIESNSTYQLSYLDMGFQGDANEISESINYLKSTHTNYSNLVFEIRPSCSFQLYHSKKWYYTNIIGINTSAPPKVNQISTKTDFTELRNETAFILESFARELKVKIGDSITLYTLAGVKEVTITGLVKSIEFLSYDLSLEGAIYLNYETFQDYNSWTELQFNSIAFYFPNEPPIDTIKQFAKDLKEEVDPFKAQILYEWYVREFSISTLFQDVLNLTSQVLFVMACAIILGAGIVIFLITKRHATEQRRQTGMLYAFGFQPRIILRVFMLRTLIISLISIAIGMLGAYGLLRIMVQILISRWGIPIILTKFSAIGLIVVPLLVIFSSQLFTYFACRSNVKMTPYEAIRGKSEFKLNPRRKRKTAKKSFFSIGIKYPLRNLARNRVRGALITSAFIGAIAISFALIQTQTSINSTFDNYFTDQIYWDLQLRFDGFKSVNEIQQIIEDYDFIESFEPYLHSNIQLEDNPDYGLELRGFQFNTSLYSIKLKKGSLFSNETVQEGIISSYSAKPLGLDVGDNVNFSLLGVDLQIKIVGIARDLDVPNSLLMTLPAIENNLGFPVLNYALVKLENSNSLSTKEVNAILLELNENSNIQYAIMKETYEEQMVHMVNTQLFIVKVTVVLSLIISFLIIFVTAFISIVERTREIALLRTFGFLKSQIFSQLFVEIGSLISIAVLVGLAVGGEGLGRMIQFLIGKLFFELDTTYFWGDYLMIIGFTAGCVLLSTLPSLNLLRKQKLATAIIE
ncbi:MAG: FtsX-like permease family protein [Candidatus Heimdallarchaeota archaeon]|nr:FtsX-like permease family protein [Candidatus Heimdallarchaeota archaeon]